MLQSTRTLDYCTISFISKLFVDSYSLPEFSIIGESKRIVELK